MNPCQINITGPFSKCRQTSLRHPILALVRLVSQSHFSILARLVSGIHSSQVVRLVSQTHSSILARLVSETRSLFLARLLRGPHLLMLTLFFFSYDSQSRYRQNKGFWRLVSVKDEKRVSETSLRRVKKKEISLSKRGEKCVRDKSQ